MDLYRRYFITSIHFNYLYDFSLVSYSDDIFIDTDTSDKYRMRLLFDCGYGQEYGYEMLPPLSFSELITLIESYTPFKKPKLISFHRINKDAILKSKIADSNYLGAISVIMQDHVNEFIDFLSEKIESDYFDDHRIRKNYIRFSFSSEKMKENGKLPSGIHSKSFENILNRNPKWKKISNEVIDKIYL